MRVLILSQYYEPEPIPKPGELAAELRRRGHDVTVVTGLPNYPSGDLYPGYRLGWLQREQLDGIPVVRTFEYPYHGTRMLGRILNYFSFMCTAPFGLRRVGPVDVIYVWHPPLTVGVAAWVMSRMRRIPFVYDVQDIWPESGILSGMLKRGAFVRAMEFLERFVYRKAHHIFVVTEGARRNLVAKGVPQDRVTVMPHWVDDGLFTPVDVRERTALRAALGWEGRFVVAFAGNIGLVQGLESVIDAIQQLPADSPVLLSLIGDGTDRARLQQIVAHRGLSARVQFAGRQPPDRMPGLLAATDALLVHLRHSDLTDLVIPTKTLAYLAAERPIIMAMTGAAAELILAAEAGVVVPPEDPGRLADAILRLAASADADRAAMGRRGRSYLEAHFTRGRVILQYESLLKEVAATPAR